MVKTATSKNAKKLVGENVVLIAGDIGFNSSSLISSAKPNRIHVFPSGVVSANTRNTPNKEVSEEAEISLDYLRIRPDSEIFDVTDIYGKAQEYFVGKNALNIPTGDRIREFNRNRGRDFTSQLLFHTLIGYGCPDVSGDYEVYFTTGLPNDDADEDKIIEKELRDFLEKPFTIDFINDDGEIIRKHITVKHLEIIPQPEGTFSDWSFRYNRNVDVTNENDYIVDVANPQDYVVAMIDIGQFTTDYSLYVKGEYYNKDGESGSTHAVESIYKALQALIKQSVTINGSGYVVSDKELDELIMNNGIVSIGGEPQDFSKELELLKKRLAQEIVKKVMNAWGTQAYNFSAIILTGGGAELMRDELTTELSKYDLKFSIAPEAAVANTRGYYIKAVMDFFEKVFNDDLNYAETLFENYVPEFLLVEAA